MDLAARHYRDAVVVTSGGNGGPVPTSVATLGDRIIAVGSDADCVAALPTDHEIVDVGGRTLSPGLVDAHLHPLIMAVFEQQLLLDQCGCLADVFDLVAERALQGDDGTAIMGFQLDDAVLAERRLPTAIELDACGRGRPVILVRRDGHHAVASTSALVAAGFDRPGNEPAGGVVERDASGRPIGLVRENAVAPLLALMPDLDLDGLALGVDAWADRLVRQGVTGISAICQTTAEGPSGVAGELEVYGWEMFVDRVPFDVQTILVAPDLAAVDAARSTSLHAPARRRRVDAVKLFIDGTLGGHTACMHQPFSDRPETAGMRTMDSDEAERRTREAHARGLAVCVHAIGDRANREAAEMFRRVVADDPGPHRHRVEHASVLDDPTVELLAELGVSAVVQPISLRSERHWLRRRVGDERMMRTYPFRSLLDAGVNVAGSSDAPIERTDPFAAMAAATERMAGHEPQAISATEALGLYTTGAARARGCETDQGAIRVGGLADLVVLSADPRTSSPDQLERIDVLSTVIGGAECYRDPRLSSRPSREGAP